MGFARQEYWSGVPLPSLDDIAATAKQSSATTCMERKSRKEGIYTYIQLKVRLVKAVVFPVVVYRCESWTRLSDFTFTFLFHALEKEMATHSSVLAWRIPGMGEPGGLPSMGSHRVGHD